MTTNKILKSASLGLFLFCVHAMAQSSNFDDVGERRAVLQTLRPLAYLLFNRLAYEQDSYHGPESRYIKKLWSGEKPVLDVIRTSKVEFTSERYCYDNEGRASNLAVKNRNPLIFCVSASYDLRNNEPGRAFARLLSKLSEHYALESGLTPEEAQNLKAFLCRVVVHSSALRSMEILQELKDDYQRVSDELLQHQDDDPLQLCSWFYSLYERISERDLFLPDRQAYAFLDSRPGKILSWLGGYYKVALIGHAGCSLVSDDPEVSRQHRTRYQSFFGGESSVDSAVGAGHWTGSSSNVRSGVLIRNLLRSDGVRTEVLRAELNDIKQWADTYIAFLQSIQALQD